MRARKVLDKTRDMARPQGFYFSKHGWGMVYAYVNSYSEARSVAKIAYLLALECGMPFAAAKKTRTAAFLHDVGKVLVPARILNKRGPLHPAEFGLVKDHTIYGAWILRGVKGCLGRVVRMAALYHHEWADGSGYWGKNLSLLPAYVEVVAIADVFTALTAKRPYKRAWTVKEALSFIECRSGSQFTPRIAGVFVSLASKDKRIAEALDPAV